jgi:signal transduction histidine kinase
MSIRLRLTLYWTAVLTAILIVAGITVFLLFARQQWGQLDSALLEEADTAANAIQRGGPSTADEVVHHLSGERDLGPSRRVLLFNADRVYVDAGNVASDMPATADVVRSVVVVDGNRRVFRFAITPLTMAGTRVFLADGVDATPIRLSIYRLERNLLFLLPLILMIASSGGYWLAGRALAPISSLTTAMAAIAPRDLRQRLALGRADDEIARLTKAINALLERIEAAANRERRFAADAAHELRTPLTVLRTGLEVTLGRERTVAEYVEGLTHALGETVALCRMAEELLALARLDHEGTIALEPLDLAALVREVMEAVEPLVQAKQLELRVSLDGATPVKGDRDHLRRLVVNLIDNALKFTPEHGWIAVGLSPHDGQASLLIVDSGPAIPGEDLPHIFERFYRGKAKAESGSGLGLSLCREIVLLHGGDISAANLDTGGVEFAVTLPLADGAAIATLASPPSPY